MTVSAVDISKNLSGLDFPANKQNLIDYTRNQNASEEVINTLQQMPDQDYGSMADVEKGFGEIK
ncbi:DUF2795 domain-containing protein [Coleofasciculus sp.]|uniref:DUF2795 domain-containing protein n=1 Tax=Coleofasciculus sp. TaxID=3100458 RepID=UPI0039FA77B9